MIREILISMIVACPSQCIAPTRQTDCINRSSLQITIRFGSKATTPFLLVCCMAELLDIVIFQLAKLIIRFV